ncbi:metallophosphoesterase family protein [Clostridium sp. LP20]|uniref:metallophosphoesterase family protein n=1 Tax=Clostridium sp. LP20 TaxID=3418665 RepID=UPI003EE5B436
MKQLKIMPDFSFKWIDVPGNYMDTPADETKDKLDLKTREIRTYLNDVISKLTSREGADYIGAKKSDGTIGSIQEIISTSTINAEDFKRLQDLFESLIINGGNSNAEVVVARRDDINKVNYTTLGDRLNAVNIFLNELIVDNLTSDNSKKALSAAQGQNLKKLIDSISFDNPSNNEYSSSSLTDNYVSSYNELMTLTPHYKYYNAERYGDFTIYKDNNTVTFNTTLTKIGSGIVEPEVVMTYLPPELFPDHHIYTTSQSWRLMDGKFGVCAVITSQFGTVKVDGDSYFAAGALNDFIVVNFTYIVNPQLVKPYAEANAKAAIEKVLSKNFRGVSKMVWSSDTHARPYLGKIVDGIRNYNIYMFKFLNYLNYSINAFATIISGDVGDDGGAYTSDMLKADHKSIRRLCLPNTLFARGNHDGNNRSTILNDGVTSVDNFNSLIKGKTVNYNPADRACYYYVDDQINKVRYIILNSCDNPKGTDCSNYSFMTKQVEWFGKVALNVVDDYHVVVFSHNPILNGEDIPSQYDRTPINSDIMEKILLAFKGSTKIVESKSDGVYSYNVNCDFTENKGCKVVGWFFGHYHYDYIKTVNGITHVGIDSAYYGDGNSNPPTEGGATDNNRAAGTYTEFVADLMCVDTVNRSVDLFRVGAGKDRNFTY